MVKKNKVQNPQPKAKFYFGDIVVVHNDMIGCILKTWQNDNGYAYEIYVRSLNMIKEFKESGVQRYIVSKELSDEELDRHQQQ